MNARRVAEKGCVAVHLTSCLPWQLHIAPPPLSRVGGCPLAHGTATPHPPQPSARRLVPTVRRGLCVCLPLPDHLPTHHHPLSQSIELVQVARSHHPRSAAAAAPPSTGAAALLASPAFGRVAPHPLARVVRGLAPEVDAPSPRRHQDAVRRGRGAQQCRRRGRRRAVAQHRLPCRSQRLRVVQLACRYQGKGQGGAGGGEGSSQGVRMRGVHRVGWYTRASEEGVRRIGRQGRPCPF